ncbi:hypothetical protein AWJ20_1156 [Sugiyamaella lignohabitans]|uniref:SAM domain-containing protein n=1 Tax=Sugiyamaella lignohabitans TaxID=796027 RepID=A0A161HLE9_9ASCO|nr:uncharacterized protein AWJ20_1156 [Sugiyamaella lignohabitans]ANB12878.1 hypothetical protein AWJ20_1156 [Sugiyamaella lignohabitans]
MPRLSRAEYEEDEVPTSDLSHALGIPDTGTFDFDLRAVTSSVRSGAADDPYPAMARPRIHRSHRKSGGGSGSAGSSGGSSTGAATTAGTGSGTGSAGSHANGEFSGPNTGHSEVGKKSTSSEPVAVVSNGPIDSTTGSESVPSVNGSGTTGIGPGLHSTGTPASSTGSVNHVNTTGVANSNKDVYGESRHPPVGSRLRSTSGSAALGGSGGTSPGSTSNNSNGWPTMATAHLPSSPYLYSNTTAVSGNSPILHSSASYNNIHYYAKAHANGSSNADSSFLSGGDSPVSYHTAHSNANSSPLVGSGGHHQSDPGNFSSPMPYPQRQSSHGWKNGSVNVYPNSSMVNNLAVYPSARQPNLPYTPRSVSAGNQPVNTNTSPDVTASPSSNYISASGGFESSPGFPMSSPPVGSGSGFGTGGNTGAGSTLSGHPGSRIMSSANSSPLMSTPLKYTRYQGAPSPITTYSPTPAAPLTTYTDVTSHSNVGSIGSGSSTSALPNYLPSHASRLETGSISTIGSVSNEIPVQTPPATKVRSQSIVVSPAAVSWRANEPSDWTNERVCQWLEANKFGPDWISTFRTRNIQGAQFLSLVNYQKLKELGPFSTRNEEYDTSPSRFIHNLRKLLDKSASTNSTTSNDSNPNNITNFNENNVYTNNTLIPPTELSPRTGRPSSVTEFPRISNSLDEPRPVLAAEDTLTTSPLERIISNPIDQKASYETVQPRPRMSQPKQRPMSTFESGSKTTFQGVSIPQLGPPTPYSSGVRGAVGSGAEPQPPEAEPRTY